MYAPSESVNGMNKSQKVSQKCFSVCNSTSIYWRYNVGSGWCVVIPPTHCFDYLSVTLPFHFAFNSIWLYNVPKWITYLVAIERNSSVTQRVLLAKIQFSQIESNRMQWMSISQNRERIALGDFHSSTVDTKPMWTSIVSAIWFKFQIRSFKVVMLLERLNQRQSTG